MLVFPCFMHNCKSMEYDFLASYFSNPATVFCYYSLNHASDTWTVAVHHSRVMQINSKMVTPTGCA